MWFWTVFNVLTAFCGFSIFESFYDKNKKMNITRNSSLNFCYVFGKMLLPLDIYENEGIFHFVIFTYLFFNLFFYVFVTN